MCKRCNPLQGIGSQLKIQEEKTFYNPPKRYRDKKKVGFPDNRGNKNGK